MQHLLLQHHVNALPSVYISHQAIGSTAAHLQCAYHTDLLSWKQPVDKFYHVELCLIQLTSRGAHLTHKQLT